MSDMSMLEEQLVNELRTLLRQVNEKYKDFFHCNILTMVPLPEADMCLNCKDSEFKPECKRVVVGVHQENKDEVE